MKNILKLSYASCIALFLIGCSNSFSLNNASVYYPSRDFKTDKTVSELFEDVPKYYSTEEIKIKVTEDNKFKIIDALEQYVISKGYKYESIDGIRVEFTHGWALMRASNTGPNLTVRFEASTSDELEKIKEEFMDEIDKQKNI